MAIIATIILLLFIYDLMKFIQKKERVSVLVIYIFFMITSLIVSLFLATGKRPAGPSEWIEGIMKAVGVI